MSARAAGLGVLLLALGVCGADMRASRVAAQDAGWTIVVLGVAQDAGVPHLGCLEPRCVDARRGARRTEKVASLGVVNRALNRAYLFDATPDLRAQVHRLNDGRPLDGIFLTHAHVGHYTGLMYLGKESIAAKGVPVFGTRRMIDYLTGNGPWSLLVRDGHILPRLLEPDRAVEIDAGLQVTPFVVPHRDEFTDTVGFLIQGPRARALFIPDIDRWERWDRPIRDLAERADLAFLDGTFSSPGEVRGRRLEDIPHPMMNETRELLKGSRARLWFIHLNHTNPALDGAVDVVQEGMEFPI
jgi:pyrroloquinoline quinone biosynthesis protein B